MERTQFMKSEMDAEVRAVTMARQLTGHKTIVKIVPDISGFATEVAQGTVLVPFNNIDLVLGELVHTKVAALMLEPVPTSPGPIAPDEDYLRQVREIATDNDIVLIFNEVTTGFRLAMGGAQELYGVRPDITILGKIAGGGFPIGICCSSPYLSDAGPTIERPGTNIADALAITAGMETVNRLEEEGHGRLNQMGERMGKGLEAILNEFHVRYKATAIGPMFQMFLDVRGSSFQGKVQRENGQLYRMMGERLLENGVFFSPTQQGTNYISTAHTDADIDDAVSAVLVSLGEVTQ
jgi:glutamate-1-semialdehyde 2,1-aminomutase